jgi:PPP family 3-phenylpropionic acid transporter
MYWVTQCIFFSFAAVFLQYKNFNNTQIGIVLSISTILSIILQPVISAFADKSKRKTVRYIILTIMAIVIAFTVIFNIWNNAFLVVAALHIAINTLQITLNPLLNSIALEFLNNGYPFNFGLARGTGSVVFAVTSLLLGYAVSSFSPAIILPLFLISYIFLFTAAYFFRIKASKSSKGNGDKIISATSYTNPNPPASVLGFFLKYKRFSFLLIGITMVYYSHNLINTYLINIINNVGGDSTDMGLSLTIAAALELPMMAAFTVLAKKVKCSTLIKIAGFFFFVKSAFIWLAPNVMTVHISQAFQMLSFALFTPASIYYVNSIINEEDRNKGQAMLVTATIGISGTIASITGGKILDISTVSVMMMLGTVVALIGVIIIFFSTEKSH